MKSYEQAIMEQMSVENIFRLIPFGLLIGLAYTANRYSDVIAYADKAMTQDSDNDVMMSHIIISYIALENPKKAFELVEESIQKWPNDCWFYLLKGTVLEHRGKFKDAMKTYEIAVGLENSDRGLCYTYMSNNFLIEGKWKCALNKAELSLEDDPDSVSAVLNKSLALKKLGEVDEAKKNLEELLPKTKDEYYRACAFAILEDKETMLNELSKAIQKDIYDKLRAKVDPEFEDYRSDPDFRKLVYEEQDK